MRIDRNIVTLAAVGIAGLALGAGAMQLARGGGFSGQAGTERVVHDYLLSHPEIIPEAMNRLQARETAKGIAAVRGAIERPFAGAWAGNPAGDVTLVMFTDYNCGFCRVSAPDIDRLIAADPKLKVVWREIPILGPSSDAAARIALAAAKQGRYPAFHRAMFRGPSPSAARFAAVGREIGLDPARVSADQAAPDITQEIAANLALASRLGVDGTPAFVIGDRMLRGAVGHDALAQAIAAARKS